MEIPDGSDAITEDLRSSSQAEEEKLERLNKLSHSPDNHNARLSNNKKSENATDSHPLMHSCVSSGVSDYPDLIPVESRNKHMNWESEVYRGQYHHEVEPHNKEYTDTQLSELDEITKDPSELPDFPESPSVLKKNAQFDLPSEIVSTELSDTENDKSVYEAHLSSNLQNVALTMNEKEGNLNFLAHKKRSNKLRKVKVLERNASEESDISSLDSMSESLKSEYVFTGQPESSSENQEVDDDNSPEPIEPLSAADERRYARHWQRMVLPGGEQRTIDMRVIEPYKRVLSHGGYLRAGGHTAIVIFSACFLPDKSRVDYVYVMDNLFLYILWTLERLVTDDYVLVYLHAGATRLPAFGWLKKCYQMVGRKLRKNLNHLYLVHPTLWIKTMLFMAKPFISSKFYRKITYIATLRELMVRVPLEAAAIPDKVKAYDSFHCVT